MISKIKLAGLLILMLVASVFVAGAAPVLATNYAVTVHTFELVGDSYVEMQVDSADVYNGPAFDQLVSHRANLKSPIFSLADGKYKVVVQKVGYESDEQYFSVNGKDTAVSTILYALPDQDADTGADDGAQDGQDDGQVAEEMRIKLDINPDEAKPGEEVEVEVELDNRLGYDAEDVVIEWTVKDIDDGDDLDDEIDVGDMDKGDEEPETFTFMVPYDADEDSYTVEIKATWEDKDGKEYNNKATDILDVEKEKHDVDIIKAYLGSESVEPGRTTELAVDLANIGKSDENVRVKITSQDLGIEAWTAQFELKDGETATQYIPFTVPADTAAGKYFVDVVVYFNSGADSDMDFVTLTVEGKATDATGAVSMTPVVTTVAAGAAEKAGFTDNTFVIGGLLVGILVLLAVIAVVAKEVLPVKKTVVETRRRR